MTLQLYNTLTRTKEPLRTAEPNKVRMYVCGVTVYAPSHVGHARASFSFDVVFRYLLHRGYEVEFAKNFTDIDDKIIEKAKAEGVHFCEITDRYIADFYDAMDGIFILRPDYEPKCTEHIDGIVAMNAKLIERGHAYAVDGDVYFAVETMEDYGKLSRRRLEDQEEGARVDVDTRKRHPFDFALWKAAKPDEPSWDSPWGKGRPGWHIECSVMSSETLGDTFDIHGGGIDLLFPHHENEIAQSESAMGIDRWVTHWMHNGHLTIDSTKMSKSLGNIFGVNELLARYHPETLRMFYLSASYRAPLDYNEGAMNESEQRLERLYGTLGQLDARLGDSVARPAADDDGGWRRPHLYNAPDPLEGVDPSQFAGPERGLFEQTRRLMTKVEEAMDDDFNTAGALGHLFDYVRRLNKWMAGEPDLSDAGLRAIATGARDRFYRIGAILGLFHEESVAFFEGLRDRRLKFVGMTEAEIEAAIARRNQARADKDWAASDAIRDELAAKGIGLKDGPEGTGWIVLRGVGG
ncbi:MAG: cysteine--tRNA ligase [Proteobacteria bacterium]|nr:cysteine--tRNA ligase [Pseudomonadota bacterium]